MKSEKVQPSPPRGESVTIMRCGCETAKQQRELMQMLQQLMEQLARMPEDSTNRMIENFGNHYNTISKSHKLIP